MTEKRTVKITIEVREYDGPDDLGYMLAHDAAERCLRSWRPWSPASIVKVSESNYVVMPDRPLP